MAQIGDLTVRLILDIVQADANTKQYIASLKSAEVETQKLAAQSVTLSDRIQNIGLRFNGFQALIQVFKSSVGELTADYEAQEIALGKLENGLHNVGEGQSALNRLSNQASELQKITPFSDEEINNAQAMLTTFAKNSEQIEILTPRILDLAAAYQKSGQSSMDLQQIAVLLGKVNEDSIGQLKRVGVAFTKEQEEKLKSLKGTEQTIYLTKILDQNFKNMAETLGQTGAGQVKTFENRVGELRESLGKILQNGILPILTFFGPFIDKIASGSQAVKILTLGVLGLAAAFAVLGTSLGGLPFIIGGVVTVLFALASVGEITRETLMSVNAETLRSQEVNADMKKMLDSLTISANNMADAYDGIGKAIIGMTTTQLQSAKLFLEAEKAKILALAESTKQMKLQELAKMDFVPPDRGESIANTIKLGFAADLEKIDSLLSDIDNKLKYTPASNTVSSKTGTSEQKKADLTYLAQLKEDLKEIDERINKQTKAESEAEGLFIKKKDLEIAIKYVENLEAYKTITAEVARIVTGDKSLMALLDDELTKFKVMLQEERDNKEKIEKSYEKIMNNLQAGANLAQLISQRLEGGGKGFFYWINAALQTIRPVMSLIKAGKSKEGIGIGDIFGFLGTIIPFFLASGGSVPGSGSGDTVPAMLTPGEYVLNKSAVSRLGTNILNWLNGGGSVMNHRPALAGFGMSSNVIINFHGNLTDHLAHDIVSRGISILNIRRNNSRFD